MANAAAKATRTVTLTMNEDEATALYAVLRRIGGSGPRRANVSAVYEALDALTPALDPYTGDLRDSVTIVNNPAEPF